jgi:hypothetical protein
MTRHSQDFRVPLAVADKLEAVRARAWKMRLLTAAVGGIVVLLATMGISMAIDRWATLYSPAWRSLLTFSALAATGLTFLAWVVAAWRYVNRVERVAADVDRQVPKLEERWTTIAHLSSPEKARDVHPAMFRQVAAEANNYSSQVDPHEVVRPDGVFRAAWCLTAVAAILAIAVVMDSHRTAVLFKRFWLPMANISATEILPIAQESVVARGESLEIAAELKGTPVREATLFLIPEGADEQTITLVPRGDEHERLTHRVRSVKEPLRYRLRAGDGQSDWQEVAVADRPELAAATLKLIAPTYTQQEPLEFDKLPRRLSALMGSTLQFAFKPLQPVAKLHLDLSGGKEQPLLMDADGWYRWEVKVTENVSLSPILEEEHGLTNKRPPLCDVQARPDKPPVVRILTPNEEVAVRPDEKVPVTFVAKDDVRVGSAELVVFDEGGKPGAEPRILDTIPVPLGDQEGATEVKATVDLDLSKYKVQDGAQLSFAVRVREDRSLLSPVVPQQPGLNGGEVTQDEVFEGDASTVANAQQSQSNSKQPQPAPQQAASAPNTEAPQPQPAEESVATAEQTSTDDSPASEKPTSPTDEPSAISKAISKAIAEAMPEKLKDLAAKNAGPEASSASAEPSTGADPNVTASKETTSDRQSLSTASSETAQPQTTSQADQEQPQQVAQSSPPQAGNSSPQPMADGQPSQQANANQPQQAAPSAEPSSEPTAEQMAESESNPNQQPSGQSAQNSSNQQSQPRQPKPNQMAGSTPPPNNRAMNQLDVPPPAQSSTSNRMRLKVDEWAGSFAGQERTQLEMAISPQLQEIDLLLEKAEKLSRSVLDHLDAGNEWADAQGRDIDSAGQQIAKSLEIVEDLEQKTHGTPYAFVGLQLVNIGKAHMQPARREYWKALQTNAESRVTATRDAWQHTVRAREMLGEITSKFETARREYALAESVEKVKKMYQVFVENSMAMLSGNDDENGSSPYRRKRVEFELDEEYLARLQEVIEMRNKMRAELAKILADDPRLLRRFLDSQQNRRRILRHELEEMIESQRELNREVLAWSQADEAAKPELQAMMLQRHAETSADLAVDAAVLQDRFDTWLPLAQEMNNADVQTAAKLLQDVATATQELSADADAYIIQNQQATLKEPAEEGKLFEETAETPITEMGVSVEDIAADAQSLHNQLANLEVSLRQLGMQQDRSDLAVFAANRMVETRDLIASTSEWMRQLKQHQDGNYQNAAEVEQYRLATQTDKMAGKLANLEQQMSALLQRVDNKIPENIALKSRELLASLDEQAAPNQLSAVYALRRNQLPRAVERQTTALEAIEQAGKDYDELIQMAIKELDKLPVQDPIASLLEDPTLDELLAGLEQEFAIEELLGIPNRPSNLQISGDFMRLGGDNSVATASNQRMMMNQMLQQQRMRQRRLDRAYRRAVARALKEGEAIEAMDDELELAKETVDWNVLLSQLGDDLEQGADKAPPERYRRAIEQYFRQISRPENSQLD